MASGKDSVSLHKKANSMFHSASIDTCIAIERQAVDQLRKGKSPESGFEVLSYMGFLQSRAGNYKEALEYFQEAADSLKAMPKDSVNPKMAMRFLGNLSNLYTRFGLYDESMQKNIEAMTIAEQSSSEGNADLWRMRGSIYETRGMIDSAYYCNVKALQTSYGIADSAMRAISIAFNRCAMAWLIIEHPDFLPDSIASAVEVLENHFNGRMKATNIVLAGRGHFLLSHKSKGLEMMREGLEASRATDEEGLEFALDILAKSYAEAKDSRIFEIYNEAKSMHDTISMRKRDDIMLGKDFQYRTSELIAKNEILTKEKTISQQRSIIIIIISVMTVGMVTSYFVSRSRRHRKQRLQDKIHIEQLIGNTILLNTKIEELNQQLLLNKRNETEETIISAVIPDKESELQFRQLFSSLYPGFIEKLRKEYPSLTSGNELMCMLIKLHKSNEEIAHALGISLESVNTSRHRLRSRFNLPRHMNLNDFIQSR